MSPLMAVKVQKSRQDVFSLRAAEPVRRMNRDFQIRFTAILLALLTTAAVVYAGYNLSAERQFQVTDDGGWWVEHQAKITADRVDAGGPGTRAGVKVGDQLTPIDGHEVNNTAARTHQLYRVGAWSKATYSLVRQGVPGDVVLIPIPAERSQYDWLRLIGLIYLGVGLYVLLRRWTAPGSTHFYIFCLVSFIFYSFHYTGKLNGFDWTIYWGNVAAWMLQPALFLHFVLTFPERRQFVREHRWIIPAIYLPGGLLLGLPIVSLQLLRASEVLRWNLDRLQMTYLAVFFIAAAVVLVNSYRWAETPILRQQLKWITRGTILAITPFTLFYVIPYLAGTLPENTMKVSVLSLGLLPLTFG